MAKGTGFKKRIVKSEECKACKRELRGDVILDENEHSCVIKLLKTISSKDIVDWNVDDG